MTERLLLCTDLDRTLLPNGPQAESPDARARLAQALARPGLRLAYVTGRHRQLVLDAIEEYQLPLPDYVIGDVGTTLYSIEQGEWRQWQSWREEIGESWRGMNSDNLAEVFSDLKQLRIQEDEKQNAFKLSYYAATNIDVDGLRAEMRRRLDKWKVEASLIWSVDETTDTGLLDVIPKSATKLHAVEFLMQAIGFPAKHALYAGDSGNDLPVLTSPLRSVLVANATPQVRKEAQRLAAENGVTDALYLARGGFLGMNGNYAAGILEGIAHYIPTSKRWWEERPVSGKHPVYP